MPENESGRLSVKKTLSGLAPNILAACSSLGSIASKACLIERTISGKAITAEANTAPRQEKLKEKPNHSHKYCPIAPRFATRYYDAVTLGVDFTATDLQKNLQKAGQPWDLSKSFDGSAAIGTWVPLDKLKPVHNLPFTLSCNNTPLQAGYSGDMRHNIDDLIAYISQFFTLKTGDILFTGAPVSPNIVHINDHLEGFIGKRKVLSFNCK